MNKTTPARGRVVFLKQILKLIPREMVSRQAREARVAASGSSGWWFHGIAGVPE